MKKNMILYSVMIYVVFFVLFLMTGVVSTFVTTNKVVLQCMVTVCSWTSFFVLVVMFKRLLPGKTQKQFFKELFAQKLDWRLFFGVFAVQVVVFLFSVGIVALKRNVSMMSLLNVAPLSIISGFFVQLIGGPLGEEPAYRGFVLPYMQKRHGVIKAGLITGIVWGMWHLPLWMISGYKGSNLLLYCLTFLTSIVCGSVVMSIVNSYNKNILNTILIHQMVNFTLDILYTGDLLEIFIPTAVLYFVTTVFVCIIYRMKSENVIKQSVFGMCNRQLTRK